MMPKNEKKSMNNNYYDQIGIIIYNKPACCLYKEWTRFEAVVLKFLGL